MAEGRSLSSLFVSVVAKGMETVQAQINKLKGSVADANKKGLEVKAKGQGLDKGAADAKKGGGAEKAEAIGGAAKKLGSGIAAAASAAQSGLAKLGESLNNIGSKAQAAFAIGVASITGFVRAADPVGFSQMQGVLMQIAVQVGSIFLPIMDAARAMLQRVLDVLRRLTPEQKDNIVAWVKIAGAVALGLAILPKVFAAINMCTTAMTAFGVSSSFATGGITTVLGILAAAVGGFAIFGSQTEGAGDALKMLGEAVKPLIDAFKDVGTTIMDAFKGVIPVFAELGKTVVSALAPIVGLVAEVAKVFGTVLAEHIQRIAPIVTRVLGIVSNALGQIASALTPLIGAVSTVFTAISKIIAGILEKLVPVFELLISNVVRVVNLLVPVITQIVETIGQVLESLTPVITFVVGVFAQQVSFWLKLAAALLEGIAPIFTMIAEHIATMGDIFTGVMDAITPLLDMFMSQMEAMGPLVDMVFDGIKAALQLLKPVFEAVFSAIKAAIMAVARTLVYVGTLMKEIANRNFRGAMSAASQAVRDFEDRIEERSAERARQRAEGNKTKDRFANGAKLHREPAGRHAPMAQQKVDIIGISELWRKAQTATAETPEQKARQEQLRLMQEGNEERKKTNKHLEEIKEKEGGGGFGP